MVDNCLNINPLKLTSNLRFVPLNKCKLSQAPNWTSLTKNFWFIMFTFIKDLLCVWTCNQAEWFKKVITDILMHMVPAVSICVCSQNAKHCFNLPRSVFPNIYSYKPLPTYARFGLCWKMYFLLFFHSCFTFLAHLFPDTLQFILTYLFNFTNHSSLKIHV